MVFAPREIDYLGLVATAPPLPSPGRTILDTLAFMEIVGRPWDLLFFQSWPDEIKESLSAEYKTLEIHNTSGILGAVWSKTSWGDFNTKLTFHSSNSSWLSGFGFGFLSGSGDNIAARYAQALVNAVRIQLAVSWCQHLCLPENTSALAAATNTWSEVATEVLGTDDISKQMKAVMRGMVTSFAEAAETAKKNLSSVPRDSGLLQWTTPFTPPLVAVQYGDFARFYGLCKSVNVSWQSPFTPLLGYPQRATVDLSFMRIFPWTQTPTQRDIFRRGSVGLA